MVISFTCEKCGKHFQVEEHLHGKRGRCSQCGHVMKIPESAGGQHAPLRSGEQQADSPFKLSPPEPHPGARDPGPTHAADAAGHPTVEARHSVFAVTAPIPGTQRPHVNERHAHFELLNDDADLATVGLASPEVARGLQEIAEFEKERRGYKIDEQGGGSQSILGRQNSGPAGWLYTKWRGGVGSVLKLFRWIDTWAYLLSVPFLVLMIFGIVAENRVFVHTGAVVVVLANYGRFWADLLAFFVRPFKDGPFQGLAFLFPPYTIYYLVTRWHHMRRIVRRIAMSCIPILGVILIYAFVPRANPEIQNVKGIGAKLRAGEQELNREITSDFKGLEEKLIPLQKRTPSIRNPNLDGAERTPSLDPDRSATRPNLEDLPALDRTFAVFLLFRRVGGFRRSRRI